MPKYSIVVPVYNRPQEISELLYSIKSQHFDDFEIIVVEDGSINTCESVIKDHASTFKSLKYVRIENSGPGGARNFGARHAAGEWLIFLDSDTLVPAQYLLEVDEFIIENPIDAFGGGDRDRVDFLPIQKAISYAMTSFLTTGGIRGSSRSLEKFKPRSFNMGLLKTVFEKVGGFSDMRYGEDIDLSLRLEKGSFRTAFVPKAYVYHKRRTTFAAFFRQIRHSGEARIALSKKHKGSLKLVHMFPVIFLLGFLASLFFTFLGSAVLSLLGFWGLVLYGLYFFSILLFSTIKHWSLRVGFLAMIASIVQLSAYGLGFLSMTIKSRV
ncbi:MAG: glycosyltransferase [Bacteroidota bacterium]